RAEGQRDVRRADVGGDQLGAPGAGAAAAVAEPARKADVPVPLVDHGDLARAGGDPDDAAAPLVDGLDLPATQDEDAADLGVAHQGVGRIAVVREDDLREVIGVGGDRHAVAGRQ